MSESIKPHMTYTVPILKIAFFNTICPKYIYRKMDLLLSTCYIQDYNITPGVKQLNYANKLFIIKMHTIK